MSWLGGSPKRQGSKGKTASRPSAKSLWSSSTTRTYGSNRRPALSSLRGSAAAVPSLKGGRVPGSQTAASAWAGGVESGGAQHGSGLKSLGLSSTFAREEEDKSPSRGSLSLSPSLSPGFDSSPIELAFSNRGLDLDLESPGEIDRAAAGKAGGGRGKAKKPVSRSRRGASATRMAAGATRGSSDDRTGSREAEVKAFAPSSAAPKRKVPSVRKGRSAKVAGGGGRGGGNDVGSAAAPIELSLTDPGEDEGSVASGAERGKRQASPSARRDRSPARRGAGRPDRWADRSIGAGRSATKKSASPLSSPLRAITNSSEGDRSTRAKDKADDAKASAGDLGSSGSGSGRAKNSSGSSSSSSEEEWQDEGMDFTKSTSVVENNAAQPKATGASSSGRPSVKAAGRRRKSDKATRDAAAVPAPVPRGTRSSARERTRAEAAAAAAAAKTAAAKTAAKAEGWSSAASASKGQSGDDMATLDGTDVEVEIDGGDGDGDGDRGSRHPTPPPLSSPGGVDLISREVKLSLDSSAEGILVGDKRRRGKRGARNVEDSAHRSSRSRHLSPLIPVAGSLVKYGFSVEEEDDSELEDAAVNATPDNGDDLDDVVIDLSRPSSPTEPAEPAELAEPKSTRSTATAIATATQQGGGGAATAEPPVRPGVLKRASSLASGLRGNMSAPALAMTTSPPLDGLNKRTSRENLEPDTHNGSEVSAATALAQAASVDELMGVGPKDDGPQPRLSRSLSASQSSAVTSWCGASTATAAAAATAAGCAKVTRSSHRRRSRANSTSSPLPVLEMMATAAVGLEDAAGGADWTSRSFGSGGFSRHGRRGSYSGCGVGGSVDNPRKKNLWEGPAMYGSGPLVRSHRMPVWNQTVNQGNSLKRNDRPVSLPSGITRNNIRGVQRDEDASFAGGDAGFGWVLRSPESPVDHRRRSRSFTGGRSNQEHARSESYPSSGLSSMTGMIERPTHNPPPGASDGDRHGRHTVWARMGSEEHMRGPVAEDTDGHGMSVAQTPQMSPSKQGMSAALQRAHGLSSMARRMDRLEIRSPNVDTHAAEAHQEIMASPMAGGLDHADATATPVEASGSTPVRPQFVSMISHLTPVGNWNPTNDRSRLSGAGGSPTECFRDYLSGLHGKEEEEEEAEEHLSGNGTAKNRGEYQAPGTPGVIATPTAPTSNSPNSPPGVNFTRTAALGLPSPILTGLFGDTRGRRGSEDSDGYTVRDRYTPAGSGGGIDCAPSASDTDAKRLGGGGGMKTSSAAADGTLGDSAGAVGKTQGRGSPQKVRRGFKLKEGARAQTMPICGTRESPEGGFLIRRKTIGNTLSCPTSSSTAWLKPYGGEARGDDNDDDVRQPPVLGRLGSASRSSGSLYLSCLSSGCDGVQSPDEEDEEDAAARHGRSLSSPVVGLTEKKFDTPSAPAPASSAPTSSSALGSSAGAGGPELQRTAVDDTTSGRGLDGTSGARSARGSEAPDRENHYGSPAFQPLAAPVAAASGVSDRSGRRVSTESVGATTCRAQFETPQPETKLKWGSQPQFGDWGTSQPASAGSLRHLTSRLMAFAGRSSSGGRDSEDDWSSPGAHPTGAPPLCCATTPLADLPLLPPTRATTTPVSRDSLRSGGGAGSLLAYRNSLGSVSEREEGGLGGGDHSDGTMVSEGANEYGVGDLPIDKQEEGLQEKEGHVTAEGGARVEGSRDVWASTVFGDRGARRRGGSIGLGRGGRRRDRPSSLMTDNQKDEQRRRQSIKKRRRVSLSIKQQNRQSGSIGLSSRLAGMSLLEVAEASSPGPGKVEPRSRLSPFPRMAPFTGGTISEGEEENEEEERQGQEEEGEEEKPRAKESYPPEEKNGQGWESQSSPMSVEKVLKRSESRGRLVQEARGETPPKVREDLERSLTELNNLSLSICNSEEDASPKPPSSRDFLLGLDSASPMITPTTMPFSWPNPGGIASDHSVAAVAAAAAAAALAASPSPPPLPSQELPTRSTETAVESSSSAAAAATARSAESALEALRRPGVIAKALRMLSVDELLGDVPVVCAAWRKAAVYAFAEVASDMGGGEKTEGEVDAAAAVGTAQARAAANGRGSRGRATQSGLLGAGSSTASSSSRSVWSEERLLGTFPWGGFLSEGACKQVHKVWNASTGCMEALSVMDREELQEEEAVVSREVRVSILASSLVQRRISPNFVQTLGLFRSASPLPLEVYGAKEDKYPCGRSPGILRHRPRVSLPPGAGGGCHGRGGRSRQPVNGEDLRYQYIGMELCEYGDAEVFIKSQEDKLLPTVEAQGFLFQMAFALYAGRAELSLRHFDVKLLNFFVSDAMRLLSQSGRDRTEVGVGGGQERGVTLRYGVGEDVMELHLPRDRAYLVKLADFGTADVDPLTVGNPVEKCHFSTLENTPIEQLCCGNQARQGYACDTFALALAAFHLFTGEAPYEEIMEEVECPDELYDALVSTWDQNSQYMDVCDIILNDLGDEGDDDLQQQQEDVDQQDPTLVHTFYRYLVLFGVPERESLEQAYGRNNPVWKAVGPLLGWKNTKRGRGGGRGSSSLATASKKFCRQLERDRAKFSLDRGKNKFVRRARARLQELPGAMELIKSMASFIPEERPTMLEVLTSDVFSAFRRAREDRGGSGSGGREGEEEEEEETCVDFMAFARREGQVPLLAL